MKKNFRNTISENFFLILSCLALSGALSNDMYLPAIPNIAQYFGISSGEIQLGVMWWLIGVMLTGVFIGPLSDMFGRKKPLLACCFISIGGSIICGVSTDPTMLMIARVLEGTVVGAMNSVGIVSMIDYYRNEKAVRALSVSANFMAVSPIIGPIVGALFVMYMSWRYIFHLDAILVFLVALMLIIFMPETHPKEKRDPEQNFFTPFKLIAKVGKDPILLTYCVSTGFTRIAFIFWIAGGPVILIEQFHLSPSEYAIWQMPVIIAYVAGNLIITAIANKLNLRKAIIYMHIIYFITCAIGLVLSLTIEINIYLLIGICCAIYIPIGLLNSPKTTYVITIQETYRGTSSTIHLIVSYLLNILGVKFLVTLHDEPVEVFVMWLCIFGITSVLVGFIAEYFLTIRRRHEAELLT